jgi:hypothetical protein
LCRLIFCSVRRNQEVRALLRINVPALAPKLERAGLRLIFHKSIAGFAIDAPASPGESDNPAPTAFLPGSPSLILGYK